MFSTRFLRGALDRSSVTLFFQHEPAAQESPFVAGDSRGSEHERTKEVSFHWQENEDAENVIQRFHAQVVQAQGAVSGGLQPGPRTSTITLRIDRVSSNVDSNDAEIVYQLIAMLKADVVNVALKDGSASLLTGNKHPHPSLKALHMLDLSGCGFTTLPAAVCQLPSLKHLLLSNNKLTTLPDDLQLLTSLESLVVNDNQLNSLPVGLRNLKRVTELSFQGNKLSAPNLDLRNLTRLEVLRLGNNPLRFLPELSYATNLIYLSLGSISISADRGYTQWTVTLPPRDTGTYVSLRVSMRARDTSAIDAVLALLFSRSACQHPLLAGGLAEIAKSREMRSAIRRADRALPQLVLMMLSDDVIVSVKACDTLALLSGEEDLAAQLEQAAVVSSIHALMMAADVTLQLAGLKVLTALAVASDAVASKVLGHTTVQLLSIMIADDCTDVCCAALLALSSLAFPLENKAVLLRQPGLLDTLERLAAPDNGAGDKVRVAAVRGLAVLGQNVALDKCLGLPGIRDRGLRILALDGGGMKGVAEVQLLEAIEKRTGRKIHELFDVIGGTSTGCMLAVGVGIMKLTLCEMRDVYLNLGRQVFSKDAAEKQSEGAAEAAASVEAGSGSWTDTLFRMYKNGEHGMRVAWYGAKHGADVFERLLKDYTNVIDKGCLDDKLIDAAWLGAPKVFGCATEASVAPGRPFIFRTYEFPPDDATTEHRVALNLLEGTSKVSIWRAIRASSAAPYYLDEFVIGAQRFQDGGAMVNNPSIVAVQEARALFPACPIDCVVSIGGGSVPTAPRPRGMSSYLETGALVIDSACSVDRAHEALAATLDLAGCHYARFNPVDARCGIDLDCTDTTQINSLLEAVDEYVTANESRVDAVCQILLSKRTRTQDAGTTSGHSDANGPYTSGSGARPGVLLLSGPVRDAKELPNCVVAAVAQSVARLQSVVCVDTTALGADTLAAVPDCLTSVTEPEAEPAAVTMSCPGPLKLRAAAPDGLESAGATPSAAAAAAAAAAATWQQSQQATEPALHSGTDHSRHGERNDRAEAVMPVAPDAPLMRGIQAAATPEDAAALSHDHDGSSSTLTSPTIYGMFMSMLGGKPDEGSKATTPNAEATPRRTSSTGGSRSQRQSDEGGAAHDGSASGTAERAATSVSGAEQQRRALEDSAVAAATAAPRVGVPGAAAMAADLAAFATTGARGNGNNSGASATTPREGDASHAASTKGSSSASNTKPPSPSDTVGGSGSSTTWTDLEKRAHARMRQNARFRSVSVDFESVAAEARDSMMRQSVPFHAPKAVSVGRRTSGADALPDQAELMSGTKWKAKSTKAVGSLPLQRMATLVSEAPAPSSDAPCVIVLALHPAAPATLALAHRCTTRAVAEPSEEAAALSRRIGETLAPPGGTSSAQSSSVIVVDDAAACADAQQSSACSTLACSLGAGTLIHATDGSGVLWQCVARTTHAVPDPHSGETVTLDSVLLHEYVPEHTVTAEELASCLEGRVHDAVVVSAAPLSSEITDMLLGPGCEAAAVLDAVEAGADAHGAPTSVEGAAGVGDAVQAFVRRLQDGWPLRQAYEAEAVMQAAFCLHLPHSDPAAALQGPDS